MRDELEDARYVVASDERIEILRLLGEAQAPRDLNDSLSISRSTVQRVLSGYLERGWLERLDDGYRRTESGDLVFRKVEELLEVLRFTSTFAPVLPVVEPHVEPSPLDSFDDVTVTESSASRPHAPVRRYRTLVERESFETFRGSAPILLPVFEEIHRPLVEEPIDVELVVTEQVIEELRSSVPEQFEDIRRLPDFDLYGCSTNDLVGVSVVDDWACLGSYRDGRLHWLLDGGSPDFRSLVLDVYRSIRERSKLLEVGDSS